MGKTIVQSFRSITELLNFIESAPLNEVYKNSNVKDLPSHEESQHRFSFTGTQSFEEAKNLLKFGWSEMAHKLNVKLQASKRISATDKTVRNTYDVVGFQASVPRYLQGIPTNMINKKQIMKKQPVVTIIKSIGYNAFVSKEEIQEQSIKALQIIQRIEESGIRVNLDIAWYRTSGKQNLLTRVRIKSANERLNISKMAFPLVHPSMLRRIGFAQTERCIGLTDNNYRYGYGRSENQLEVLKPLFGKNEYVIPGVINNIEQTIKDMGLNIK